MRRQLLRPALARLHAYVPGEQPKIKGLIKLNTNENPYPPAPEVLEAIREAVDGRLRLYPNPTAQPLREKLAKLHGCGPENIIVGNGSDELLAMALRAFVDPAAAQKIGAGARRSSSGVNYFVPSYSLYPVLVDIHGATRQPYDLRRNFALPPLRQLKRDPSFDKSAALTFLTTPNAPSGTGYSTAELEGVCELMDGVVVLDEAYVDFARENAMALALKHPHVLVCRTFSKAYSLCFQRVGYMVGHQDLIAGLDKIRDSYNVNGLGQIAALATLEALPYYRKNFKRIIETREWVSHELQQAGFEVLPSQTNFILATPPGRKAQTWLQELRDRKILVRWFDQDATRDYLRITIGTDDEMQIFMNAVKAIAGRKM